MLTRTDNIEEMGVLATKKGRATGKWFIRFIAGLAAIGLGAALFGMLGSLRSGGGTDEGRVRMAASGSIPTISVLDRPRTERDVLPPDAVAIASHSPVDLESLRLAAETAGWRVFLGRPRADSPPDVGDFCVVMVTQDSTGVSCAQTSVLVTDGAKLTSFNDAVAGSTTLVGVVGDGVSTVAVDGSEVGLGENAFIATGIPGTGVMELRITDAAGTRSSSVPRVPPQTAPRDGATSPSGSIKLEAPGSPG